MSHIYKELPEIPIPEKGLINKGNGRVFLSTRSANGKRNQIVIGKATDAEKKMMHPNSMFKHLFPKIWETYYGEKNEMPYHLSAGMYGVTLTIGYRTGLYQILAETYNPVNANAIMDYVMYNILNRSNTSQLFQDCMENQVLFSEKMPNDTIYSHIFSEVMDADNNRKFQNMWVECCKKRGIKHIWLSVDGSNSDNNLSHSELAEKGKAKSRTSSDIISYIWAINADDGTPIAYRINNGSMVDSKALVELISYLQNYEFEIEGVILDCGFCKKPVIDFLKSKNLNYIIMLTSNVTGHVQIYENKAEMIRWNVNHIVSDSGIFGISDEVQLFQKKDEKAYVNLYFDGINGSERATSLIKNVLKIKKEATIKGNGTIDKINSSNMSRYFKMEKNGLEVDIKKWQQDVNGKGYYSILSSQNYGAEYVYHLYHKRDASEKQFSILKTQLDFNTVRVHSDKSLLGKYTLCFISAIIRSEILKVARKYDCSTNKIIVESNRVIFDLDKNGTYHFIHNLSERQKKIFSEFEIEPNCFENMVSEYNAVKQNPIHHQMRQDPHQPFQVLRGKRGRPKGSKNKKTIERNQKTEENNLLEKRGRGRPKGSKNKKTIERNQKTEENNLLEKRGRGRPKGSKNKLKIKETRDKMIK